MTTLGKKLLKLRQSEEVTQADMAKRINYRFDTNINGSMWSKWENDKDVPSMDNLRVISSYFNVSLDYLSGISDKTYTSNDVYSVIPKNLKVLFNLADDLSQEDINFLTDMAKRLKGE